MLSPKQRERRDWWLSKGKGGKAKGKNKSKKGNRAKGNKGRQVNQIHWNLRLRHSSDILTLSALLQHHSSQTALHGKICDSAEIESTGTPVSGTRATYSHSLLDSAGIESTGTPVSGTRATY